MLDKSMTYHLKKSIHEKFAVGGGCDLCGNIVPRAFSLGKGPGNEVDLCGSPEICP